MKVFDFYPGQPLQFFHGPNTNNLWFTTTNNESKYSPTNRTIVTMPSSQYGIIKDFYYPGRYLTINSTATYITVTAMVFMLL